MLSVEPLAGDLSVPGAATTRKVTYRTQWRSGQDTVATGVLFLPPGEAPADGWPVLAWAHGTTGLSDSCAPSRTPRSARDTAYLDHWLGQGYAVVAADYPDLGLDGLTTFSAYIFAGLRDADPELDLDSYLTDAGREVLAAAEDLCYEELMERYAGVGIGDLLTRPLAADRFRAAFTDYLGVPVTGDDRPIFLAQGLRDTMVPAPLSFMLAADLTAGGAAPLLRTYPTGHSETMAASLPDTTPFVADLFAAP